MALTNPQKQNIEKVLRVSLRNKFRNYRPETSNMPFHTRLLGKDRLALYSFIHSLNTSFGTSIFEPVGIALANPRFKSVRNQVKAGDKISSESQLVIQGIIDNLTISGENPNKKTEIEQIRNVCQKGEFISVKPIKVDLLLETEDEDLFLIDIKTAKPNIGNFREFKRTLLEWVAVILAIKPNAKINTLIAIPYNPYEPQPYHRWTIRGMLDLQNELKVADEFWDFLGGENTYHDLLDCFERVGIELRDEIDEYFLNFKK
jgi:hypothetical protein